MDKTISLELQAKIEQEAESEAKKLTGRVPVFRIGYKEGHYDGAEKYALKWEQAEKQLQQMAKALESFAQDSCDYESTNFAKALHSPECRACNARQAMSDYQIYLKQGKDGE